MADLSTAKLVQVVDKSANIKADVLMIQVDRDLRSNDKRLVLEDVGDPITNETGKGENGRRRYVVKVGQTLRMGTRATGYESYRLVRVDEAAPLYFIGQPEHPENLPAYEFVVADNDMEGRLEQTELMCRTMFHVGYPDEAVTFTYMEGYTHTGYCGVV